MVSTTSAQNLELLLKGKTQFALIDVRDTGEYNSSHIPGSSLIPRKQLEFDISRSVPVASTPIVLCCDDGRRSSLAVETLKKLRYSETSALEGGINRWVTDGLPTEWGVNVPSKDFGEKVEVEHHVPEIEATDLQERIKRGDEMVILDTRTPEEYSRFCIPGGRSVPGGELALYITDITRDLSDDATVIINCAGRTRSIIGTRVLQRMGIKNILGLKNGTSGWVLAGYELETGADRLALESPSAEAVAAAEAYADKLAEEDGVRPIDVAGLRELQERASTDTTYLVDVRSREEYSAGHIPGFRWVPGGQAVQRTDEVAVVKNANVVFACDGKARATQTASFYRQLGIVNVFVLQGGTTAWQAAGEKLEQGNSVEEALGLATASAKSKPVSTKDADSMRPINTIFVDTSQDFATAHVPGSNWITRGWLELNVDRFAADKSQPILVTCADGRNSVFAAATLIDMGYSDVLVLQGGLRSWQADGLDVESGLTGVMAPPSDVLYSGPDRTYAEMMHYLRWETALGEKYA